MNREELEGVIAHEMSHIKNYDIRMMMLVAVLIGIVALLSDFILRSFLWGGGRRRDSKDGGGVVVDIPEVVRSGLILGDGNIGGCDTPPGSVGIEASSVMHGSVTVDSYVSQNQPILAVAVLIIIVYAAAIAGLIVVDCNPLQSGTACAASQEQATTVVRAAGSVILDDRVSEGE